MTDKKPINSQKSQDPPIENGDDLDTMQASEWEASDHATSNGGSGPHVENETTDDLDSEEISSAAGVSPPAEESQNSLSLLTAERDELKDQPLLGAVTGHVKHSHAELPQAQLHLVDHVSELQTLPGANCNQIFHQAVQHV